MAGHAWSRTMLFLFEMGFDHAAVETIWADLGGRDVIPYYANTRSGTRR